MEARTIPSTGSLHRILVAIIMASCFLAAFISAFPFTSGTMLFGNFFLTFSGRLSALLLFILPSSEVDDQISFAQSVQTVVRDYPLLQLYLKNQDNFGRSLKMQNFFRNLLYRPTYFKSL